MRPRARKEAVQLLKGAVVAAASQGEAAAEAARAALAAAEANAEAARAPPNFPVQLAFAPNGAELAAHTLEGWCQLAPDDDIVSCDTRNMYNECRRAPSFEALREHDPECVPVYSMLYAHEAEIYLDRTRSGAMVQLTMDQVCARAARLGVEGLEETEDPDAELDSIPILFLFC